MIRNVRLAIALGLVLGWGGALALDDLITSELGFEPCPALIVPVLIHTMPGGEDLQRFAALLERRQDIGFTDSHYLPWELTSIGILVDLLQAAPGGTIVVSVHGMDEALTWRSTVHVPPLEREGDVVRRVVAVEIPAADVSDAFPGAGIYRISATSVPLARDGRVCGSGASTSILVDPGP